MTHRLPSRLVLAGLFFAVIGGPLTARAWDTITWTRQFPDADESEEWKSPYVDLTEGPGDRALVRNEHTWLAEEALRQLGAEVFTLSGQPIFVSDLNASHFRPAIRGGSEYGDDLFTPLEERRLPSPSQFAGMPDYSFTVYDWINKNRLCPAVPPEARELLGRDVCHRFEGWMGALNSNHFGTLATLTYVHYHGIALTLARRAAELRSTLEEGSYDDFVREAEHAAMLYEGYAQHFLQDRWSMGHMWERWNAPDYEQLESKSLLQSLGVGAAAGILHGAEGGPATAGGGLPDPMCSPQFVDGEARPVELVHPELGLIGGVGDYRAEDMFDGQFGAQYQIRPEVALEVSQQRELMLDCSMAGFAEVIREFGEGSLGGYGLHSIVLDGVAPDFRITDETGRDLDPLAEARCFDMWATDEAIVTGWEVRDQTTTIGPSRFSVGNRARWVLLRREAAVVRSESGLGRTGLVETSFRVRAARLRSENRLRTELAEGGIGPYRFGGALFLPGSDYQLAAYREPAELTGLQNLPLLAEEYEPEGDRPGRDRATLHGFFNRTFAPEWCDQSVDLLAELRNLDELDGSPEPADRDRRVEVCAYLADRIYAGTDPDYLGVQGETVAGLEGQPARPLCDYYGVVERGDDEDPAIPYYIHPGYVRDGAPGDVEPEDSLVALPIHESLRNWCRRLPVVHTDDRDIAAHVSRGGGTFALGGLDFGESGTLELDEQPLPPQLTITEWGDERIALELTEPGLDVGTYAITVNAEGGFVRQSVGRFLLDVREPPPPVAHIATGLNHTCVIPPAVDSDGSVSIDEVGRVVPLGDVWCWGDNSSYQLGHRSGSEVIVPDQGAAYVELTPRRVVGVADARAVSAGAATTCALLSTGRVLCWGLEDVLGDGSEPGTQAPCPLSEAPRCSATPTAVDGLDDAVAISVAAGFACALRETGEVVCWGQSQLNHLGTGALTPFIQTSPVLVPGVANARLMDVGDDLSCAADEDGELTCWGLSTTAGEPDLLGPFEGIVDVQTGGSTIRALLETGEVLGTIRLNPTVIRDGVDVLAVSPFDSDTCYVRSGEVVCDGDGRLPGPDGVLEVNLSRAHHCILRDDADFQCWGDNDFGQLGDGTLQDRVDPVSTLPLN